jgi:peptidoglycan hydrolase-like protein with peptidoglycan-binding domain
MAGANLSIDGSFGSRTASAVQDFQASQGLDVDGTVGPMTWEVLVTRTNTLVPHSTSSFYKPGTLKNPLVRV